MRRWQQQGFTLVEVLVSLFVLSILGVVLATGMGQVTQWQQALLTDMNAGREQLRFQSLIMNDLLQLAPRSVTDAYGGQLAACLSIAEHRFEFSRFERSTDGAGVVRIGYDVMDGKLWRWRYPVLDRAPTTEPSKQLVLDRIDQMLVRWQDNQGVWHAQWPLSGAIDLSILPRQIEMVLSYQQQEQFRMHFPTGESMP